MTLPFSSIEKNQMTRKEVYDFARSSLTQFGLDNWKLRISAQLGGGKFLSLCSHKDSTIYINANAIDIHPKNEIVNTVLHEIAHAIVGPNHGHDDIWKAKAREIGCDNTGLCGLSLNPIAIDAIRSGHIIEVIEESEVVRKVSYKVHRLTEKCPVCLKMGKDKDAIVKNEFYTKDGLKKVITYQCNHIVIKDIPRGTPYDEIVFDGLVTCKHKWELPSNSPFKTICSKCDAKRPYKFQLKGMQEIEKGLALNKGFAVFDEMGLGKTIQSLGFLKYAPPNEFFPVLFVVKSGLKFQFASEIIRVLGLNYFSQIITQGKGGVLPGLKTYVIGYDMLRNFDFDKLKSLGIKTVILDECQLIKNPDSTRTKEVRELVREIPHLIPLSGTPWKNRGSELFTVLNLLDPTKFNSYQAFLNRWVDYVLDPNTGKYKEAGIRDIPEFREYIKDLCIRRERIEVMPELPTISRNKLICEMPKVEKDAYDEAMDDFVKWFNDLTIAGEDASEQSIVAKLQRLRHLVGIAKIPFTVEHVKDYLEERDGKILLGVHHKDVGEQLNLYIGEFLKENYPEIPLLRITSDMDGAARYDVQNLYNNSKRAVLIASTLAAGEGLNLQTGDYGILHERQWNPANEEQFEGRMIRIGQQSNKVTMDYVHAQGAIDEHFDKLVDRKRVNFNNVMNHLFSLNEDNKCKICKKTEQEHEVAWDSNSLMKELAITLVEDANKNRRLKVVKGKK